MSGKFNVKYKDVPYKLGNIKGFNSFSLMRHSIRFFILLIILICSLYDIYMNRNITLWQMCVIILCHEKTNKK